MRNAKNGKLDLPIYRAINKYGFHNFTIDILESFIPDADMTNTDLIKQLDQLEIKYIEEYNAYTDGYNCTKGGDFGVLGLKMTEEQKKKVSENSKKLVASGVFGKRVHLYNFVEKYYIYAWTIKDAASITKLSRSNIGRLCNNTYIHPFCNNFIAAYTKEELEDLIELLQLSEELSLKKFIFLGSQAEYGNINGIINEEQKCEAISAYGSVKLACLELLRTFSDSHKMTWIWLRLFSLFGEKENNNWLIPSIVEKIKNENQMNLTLGEQKYAYLYVKDFASIMNKIVMLPVLSGIYNISSDKVISIRSLVEEIRNKLNPEFKLNFGAVDYRKDQSMHMQGSINKLISQIGEIEFTNFSIALENTIKYYNK